ncbi:MAG TPA: methyltransferase domain-containing protein [Terriglobia bacterium]|nr:methyltransferase domain-containing protein [Terriglobia bacterium]
MSKSHYIIRGGAEGRERLRVLSRILHPLTVDLLHRAGAEAGMVCLEAGCGGGDVALEMARMVGAEGKVVAIDIDPVKIDLARREAEAEQISNVKYRLGDIVGELFEQEFDFVHARFLLTHLPDPERALENMRRSMRPGGVIVLEDIDFRGHFCYPDCTAFLRYVELYTRTVACRGGDANIGPRLPALLGGAGFDNIQMNVVQPAGMSGEVKLMAALTMENIAHAVVSEGLATQEEIESLVARLRDFAATPGTVQSMPRIVQAWASQPR